jgi:hypothetical protein
MDNRHDIDELHPNTSKHASMASRIEEDNAEVAGPLLDGSRSAVINAEYFLG